ncbi:MAG TPA: hypothetical protein DDZ68_04725, partial [Parvularcula sp.]|nr:hypothetical protein [Parvularcula sp.]HBS33011.1 hypothetical protein [Parvularcula sp.]
MTEGGAGAAALKPHWIGHRERLRRRFLQAGIEGVADYELLEMILYRAKARGDVKPLAKAILKKFGGFAPALAAPIERLVEIDGVGEATAIEMKIIHAAAVKLAQARVLGRPVIASWEELLAYCRSAMADQKIEEFRILFLDKKNILIAD